MAVVAIATRNEECKKKTVNNALSERKRKREKKERKKKKRERTMRDCDLDCFESIRAAKRECQKSLLCLASCCSAIFFSFLSRPETSTSPYPCASHVDYLPRSAAGAGLRINDCPCTERISEAAALSRFRSEPNGSEQNPIKGWRFPENAPFSCQSPHHRQFRRKRQ